MGILRSVSTSIWTDDTILSMSPEQKLLLLYLHTNPYASACGIYKMHLKTMAFQVGIMNSPFESALKGLCAAFPDFVAVDWDTSEVALLQYPRQSMIDINPTSSSKLFAHINREIEKVESQYLLRELIARNSSTLSTPYTAQLRRLQIGKINAAKLPVENTENVEVLLDGNPHKLPENQEDNGETRNKKHNSLSTRESERKSFKKPTNLRSANCRNNLDERFQGYLTRIQLDYPVLYSTYPKCKLLLREEYKTIVKYIDTLELEKDKQRITNLVYKVHADMNKSKELIGEHPVVSGLVNKRLREQGFPSITEMYQILSVTPAEIS